MKECEIYISAGQIAQKVEEIGKQLSRDFKDRNPLIISVLKGGFVFMADLVRSIDILCEMDFMAVSSYGNNANSCGKIEIIKDLDTNIASRNVIVVEDIIDSGNTLAHLLELLHERGAKSVTLVALLDKPARRQTEVNIDYLGFSVPDEFLVGYGLDYAEKYRNLKDICILNPKIYNK